MHLSLKRIKKAPGEKLTEQTIKRVFTHDITFGLEQFLTGLYVSQQRPLLWLNYAHVGDPVAYPLATVIPKLINLQGAEKQYLDIRDISTRGSGVLEWFAARFHQGVVALINGSSAHQSYWKSPQVAQQIIQSVREAKRA